MTSQVILIFIFPKSSGTAYFHTPMPFSFLRNIYLDLLSILKSGYFCLFACLLVCSSLDIEFLTSSDYYPSLRFSLHFWSFLLCCRLRLHSADFLCCAAEACASLLFLSVHLGS